MKIGGSGQSSVGSPQSAGGRGQEIGAVSSPQSSVLSLQLAGGRGQEIGVKGARDERGMEQSSVFSWQGARGAVGSKQSSGFSWREAETPSYSLTLLQGPLDWCPHHQRW